MEPDVLLSLDELMRPGILLTSYHTLLRDLALFRQIPFQVAVLDESQVIKNAHTQLARAATQIQAQMRISLTGTPVENRAEELWSQFRFLQPDLLGDANDFAVRMMAAREDPLQWKRLQRRIHPFLLRRTKEAVAPDLPEKQEQTLWIRMGAKQREQYEKFLSDYRKNLLKKVSIDGMGKHRMEVFEAILRLRQLCCHPALLSAQLGEDPCLDSAKAEALMEELETWMAEGRKVLVYSQFVQVLELLAKEIKQRGWPLLMLHGQTQNREEVVQNFQESDTPQVFPVELESRGNWIEPHSCRCGVSL